MIGRLCGIRAGLGNILTVGNLLALALIPRGPGPVLSQPGPLELPPLSAHQRRVLVEQGLHAKVERFLDLDNFDTIEIVVLPGQEWFPAGDLIFRRGCWRPCVCRGVLRPEPFRQTCLKAQRAYVAVKRAVAQRGRRGIICRQRVRFGRPAVLG